MTQNLPLPEPLPDGQENPLGPAPDPFLPNQDPLLQGDPMLDALERSIETPLGEPGLSSQNIAGPDLTGRMLDQVEASIFDAPATTGAPDPQVMQDSQPPIISPWEIGIEESRSQARPDEAERIAGVPSSSLPPSVNPLESPGKPGPPQPQAMRHRHPEPRRRGGVPSRKGRGTLFGKLRGLFGGSFSKHPGRAPRSRHASSNPELCPRDGFLAVDRGQCESCPDYQAGPADKSRECSFWRQIRQDSEKALGPEADEEEGEG